MIASLYVFFLLFYVSHLGVYRVCLSTARQSKLCSTKKLHIFILFTSFFLRLKFSKTPFHVVLSKNKTNTKKKYHFSLLISVSFHSSQFFFCFKSVHKWTSLTPKTNGSSVCFCYFLGGFHFFFILFFSIFFLYFVTKIYFSARARLLHYDPFAWITFIPTARVCVFVDSKFKLNRARAHTFRL